MTWLITRLGDLASSAADQSSSTPSEIDSFRAESQKQHLVTSFTNACCIHVHLTVAKRQLQCTAVRVARQSRASVYY
jgi:hypothetical protein